MKSLLLNNGIKVMAEQNSDLESVQMAFYFRCGVAYETLKNSGISFLVKHLFLRNLNGIPQKELFCRIEKIGADIRACTYPDFIYFGILHPKENFSDALNLMNEFLNNAQWKAEDIESEKRVVLKKISFNGTDHFARFVEREYFKGTRWHKPIMGTEESISSLSLKEINEWKDHFFQTNNVCCVLTGGFSDSQFNEFIEKLNENERSTVDFSVPKKIKPRSFCNRTERSDLILETEGDISDICVSFDINEKVAGFWNAEVLSSILGGGNGSRLSLKLRDTFALTDEVDAKVDLYPGLKRLVIEFSVLNSDLKKSLQILFSEISCMKENLATEEIDSTLLCFRNVQKIKLDSASDRNFDIGWNLFVLNQNEDALDCNKVKISEVELKNVAKSIFTPENLIITVSNNRKIFPLEQLKQLLKEIRLKI